MRKLLGRLLGYEQRIEKLERLMSELEDLVWDHAVFTDRQGRAQGEYTSEDVAKHWERYHRIRQERVGR